MSGKASETLTEPSTTRPSRARPLTRPRSYRSRRWSPDSLRSIRPLMTRHSNWPDSATPQAISMRYAQIGNWPIERERTCSKGSVRELTAVAAQSRLRAVLHRATDLAPLSERLKQLAKGTRREANESRISLSRLKPPRTLLDTWHAILDELLELAWLRVDDDATTRLPAVPRLDAAGFTQKEKVALARHLEPPMWLGLLLFDLKDLPIFEYQVRTDDFIPFEIASPGQQATALLSILLLQVDHTIMINQRMISI